MTPATLLLFALCAGMLCGLRSFTPIAITSIAAHQGWITLGGTPFAFLGSTIAMVLLVLLALGELVADKLPKTPSRLSAIGLAGRIFLGAATAVAFAYAHRHSIALPLIVGAIGGVLGAYLGYHFRTGLVRALKSRDLPVALLEDLICIAGSFLLITRA